ncbi:MAG TPA: GMC family oxidoreductase [Stellaceae bacterium]
MFVDARETTGGAARLEADVCIVGAGAAGIAIARELARAGVSTVLLESGGMRFEDAAQDSYRGANAGLPYFALDMCQLRFFGGNTNAWGGWCRPLDAADFASRPWVAESGWPISRRELDSWYEAAQALCEVAPEPGSYDAAAWAERLGDPLAAPLPVDPGKLETKIYRFSPPTNFAARYGDEIRDAAAIQCILHANVVGIDAAPDGSSVCAVRFAGAPGGSGGGGGTVAAKLFILAAGGVENARLLLASNGVAERGLGNAHDLVGRYFMEQPHTRRLLFARRKADVPFRLYGERFRGRSVAARLALAPELQRREELLNFGANISPIHAGHDSQGWTALRALIFSLRDGRPSDPFLRFPPFDRKGFRWRDVGRLIADLPGVAAGALSTVRHGDESIAAYVLENKSEQAPNFHSRVTLDPAARDAFGMPRAKLEWRTQEIDRRTTRRAEEVIESELNRLGLADLAPPAPDVWDGWPDSLKGGWAQIGTTRMHDDPRKGVVDRHCRVHGIGNLFVAGSSIFPTSGSAPPMLTVLALSLRLAAHVKAQLAAPVEVTQAAAE